MESKSQIVKVIGENASLTLCCNFSFYSVWTGKSFSNENMNSNRMREKADIWLKLLNVKFLITYFLTLGVCLFKTIFTLEPLVGAPPFVNTISDNVYDNDH